MRQDLQLSALTTAAGIPTAAGSVVQYQAGAAQIGFQEVYVPKGRPCRALSWIKVPGTAG